MAKFTPNGSTIGNSQIYDNGTYVGIGNASPASALYIGSGTMAGATLQGIDLSNASGASYIAASNGTNATAFMGADYNDVGILGTLTNSDMTFRTDNAEAMRITSAGLVGIGTTSPASALFVGSGAMAGGAMAGIDLSNATGNSYIAASNGSNTTTFLGADANDVGIVGTQTNTDMTIWANNSEAMRATAAGLICIGTTTPTSAQVSIATSAASNGLNVISNSGTYSIYGELDNGAVGTLTQYFHAIGESENASIEGYMPYSTSGGATFGVLGDNENTGSGEAIGVAGVAETTGTFPESAFGVYGAVKGHTSYDNIAVYGDASLGTSTNGILAAGYFEGAVHVNGTLSKSSGTFKIDHPQDPANKFLYHSFVESPDMMNVYNGNITTDANGEALVSLPGYFEAENKDFRYQLTTIGQPAQVWIAEEISGNRFKVKSDKPNVKISWQVTGIRHDAWANAHRVVPEVEKTGREKGKYLHPELYGLSPDYKLTVGPTKAAMQKGEAQSKTDARKAQEKQK